jgi:hypothetical protein
MPGPNGDTRLRTLIEIRRSGVIHRVDRRGGSQRGVAVGANLRRSRTTNTIPGAGYRVPEPFRKRIALNRIAVSTTEAPPVAALP